MRVQRPVPSGPNRVLAYSVSAALVAFVLLPLLGDPRADSFPFSTYPMFSGKRTALATIEHVVGVRADGSRVPLPPQAVANDEVVQAFETVRQAVRQGPAATDALCRHAAAWAADRGMAVVSVQVASDEYHAVSYFDGDKQPRSTMVHASCAVGVP